MMKDFAATREKDFNAKFADWKAQQRPSPPGGAVPQPPAAATASAPVATVPPTPHSSTVDLPHVDDWVVVDDKKAAAPLPMVASAPIAAETVVASAETAVVSTEPESNATIAATDQNTK